MASPIAGAPMLEGNLSLYAESVCFRANKKYYSQGWASETTIPLEDIVNVDFKPGGFASGGYIIFQCARDNFQLKVTFSMGQGTQASVFIAQLERARVAQKNPVLMRVDGVNGQLELLSDRIRIKRLGTVALIGHGLKGDKEIQLTALSSIQFRAPGGLTNGYIQFAFWGGTESKTALFGATTDENSVFFTTAQMPLFVQMKAAIEEQKAKLENKQIAPIAQHSEADELEKLASLRDRGILTEEEFTAKKRQILGI